MTLNEPPQATICPSRPDLVDFIQGRLPPERTERIAAHVESCDACQRLLDELDQQDAASVDQLAQVEGRLAFTDESQCDLALDRIQSLDSAAPQPAPISLAKARAALGHGASPASPFTPRRVGDYELVEPLGEGGMGAVYKARHVALGSIYAVKLLHSRRERDRAAIERFHREMEAIGRLDHPNIVRAVDAGEEGPTHYLAMEFVDGVDVSRLTGSGASLSVPNACEIARQAAQALAYVHRHGRVHRDIKPSNLMLARSGTIKLLDLGLARLDDALEEAPTSLELDSILDSPSISLTRTNQVMGTLEYMAPEQGVDARSVDHRADIYSLGCTLYKLLAGRAPFADLRHSTAAAQILAHTQEPTPPIRELRPEVPEPLAGLVEQMLAKRPDERPQSMSDVALRLMPFVGGADLARLVKSNAASSERDTDGPIVDATRTSPDLRATPAVAATRSRPSLSLWPLALCGVAAMVMVAVAAGMLLLVASHRVVRNVQPAIRVSPAATIEYAEAVEESSYPESFAPFGAEVDLLSRVDLERDAFPGDWRREGSAIVSEGREFDLLQLPYRPSAAYRIEATVERLSGRDGPQFGLVIGERTCLMMVDNWPQEGFVSGLQRVDGRDLISYRHLARAGQVMPVGQAVPITCTVIERNGRAEVRLNVNGAEVYAWRGALQRLATDLNRQPAAEGVLFLRVTNTQLRISDLRVVSLAESGLPAAEEGHVVDFGNPQASPDRAAAMRAVWKGGEATIRDERGESRVVRTWREIPERLTVEAIDTRGSRWFHAADLAHFSNLSEIRRLSIRELAPGQGGPASLGAAPRLEELRLVNPPADVSLASLMPDAPSLRQVSLELADVDEATFSTLAQLPQLEQLSLRYSHVPDSALAQLARHESLRRLDLAFTPTSDAAGGALASLPRLESLVLDGTKVSDASIESFSAIAPLQDLSLLGCQISDAALARLRGALPNCRIAAGDEEMSLVEWSGEPGTELVGEWESAEGKLITPIAGPARLRLPIVPPPEYDLEAVIRREAGVDAIVFPILVGGRQVMVGFDHWPGDGGGWTILHRVDGLQERESPIKVQGKTFPVGQETAVTIRVRSGSVEVLRDGEQAIAWEGEPSQLSPHNYYQIGDARTLGLSPLNGRFVLSKWTLRPVSGRVDLAPSLPMPGASDLELARWAHGAGATMSVSYDGARQETVAAGGPAPSRPLWVRSIADLDGAYVTREQFDRMRQAPQLETLNLNGATFDPPDVGRLSGHPALRRLSLQATPVSDESLALLSDLPSLERLNLGETEVTDEGAAHLPKFAGLADLVLWRTAVSDVAMESISQLRGLTHLSISDTHVTGKSLEQISTLSQLHALYFTRCEPATVEQLAALQRLPRLKVLHLAWSMLGEPHIEPLAEMTALEDLRIGGFLLTDAAVARLAGLTHLKKLELAQTRITDAAMPTIAGFTQLDYLRLSGNPGITDRAVASLERLPNLTDLDLHGTSVTGEGVSRLQSSLPNCKITASDWTIDLARRQAPANRPAGPSIELSPRIDVDRDAPPGAWRREEDGSLVSSAEQVAVLQIPYLPPSEYRIEALLERQGRADHVAFGLVVDGRQVSLIIDGWPHEGFLTGPNHLAGQGLEIHRDKALRGPLLREGEPAQVAVSVRRDGASAVITVERDGEQVLAWQGPPHLLSADGPGMAAPSRPGLFVRTWSNSVRMQDLRVTPLSPGGGVIDFADRAAQPQRAAAQRALWKGGVVDILRDGRLATLDAIDLLAPGEEPALRSIRSGGQAWLQSADLRHFTSLPNLQLLDLAGSAIDDESLLVLDNLPQLESLSLAGAPVTSRGVEPLRRFRGLRRLSLASTRIDDAAASALAELESLEELDLAFTGISNEGAALIAGLKALTKLRLDQTRIDDNGARALAALPNLRELALQNVRLGDEAVDSLAKLASLERLNVMGARISADGAARLAEALPDCDILSKFSPTIDLLQLADLEHGVAKGSAHREGQNLVIERSQPSLVMFPVAPPEEYDVEVLAERTSGRDGFALALPGGGKQFLIEFDQFPHLGGFTVIDMIDGKRERQNETHVQMQAFPPGEPVQVTVSVRRDRVTVAREGVTIIDWPAAWGRVSLPGAWHNDWPQLIGVGAYASGFVVREAKLRPLGGSIELAPLRPATGGEDRQVAEWAVAHGRQVVISLSANHSQTVTALEELPSQPFWVTAIRGVMTHDVTAEQFDRLAQLSRLRVLSLENASFDERDLARLASAPALIELSLNGTLVSDEGLALLAPLRQLRALRAGRTAVTGRTFPTPDEWPALQLVQLGSSRVDREGFARVAQHTQLRHLDVAGARITDDDVAPVERMRDLRFLHLGYTLVQGPCLDRLAGLPLENLQLSRTAVDDEDLAPLASIATLRRLLVDKTKVSEEGVRRLAEALPHCQILVNTP